MKTADRLREIMEEQNLKQSDIIERSKPFMKMFDAKLTRSDLSQYCSGKVKPMQDKMFLLAAALNVSEAWLMGYDVPRNRTRELTELSQTNPMAAFLRKDSDSEVNHEYVKRQVKNTLSITSDEYDLIIAFRRADSGRQDSVRCLLGIDNKEKNENII